MADKYSTNFGLTDPYGLDDEDDEDIYGLGDPGAGLPTTAVRAPNPAREAQRKTATGLINKGVGALQTDQQSTERSVDADRQRIQAAMDKILSREPDNTGLLLGLASGFLKPTKTGSFFESLGQAGEAGLPPLLQEQRRGDDAKTRLLALQGQLSGRDIDLNKLRYEGAVKQAEIGRGLLGDVTKAETTEALLSGRMANSAALARLRAQLAADKAPVDPEAVKTAKFLFPDDLTKQQDYVTRVTTTTKDKPDAPALELPMEDRVSLANEMGLPIPTIDPYKGLTRPSQERLRLQHQKDVEKVRTGLEPVVSAARAATQDVKRFLELNEQAPDSTGALVGQLPSYKDAAKEMDTIAARLAPKMREPGSGATSDFDAKQFEKGTLSTKNDLAVNQNIGAGMLAAQQLTMDRASFMQDYGDAFGHLKGAESAWRNYVNANPIFDPEKEGTYTLNKGRKSYQDYFRGERGVKNTDEGGWTITRDGE